MIILMKLSLYGIIYHIYKRERLKKEIEKFDGNCWGDVTKII